MRSFFIICRRLDIDQSFSLVCEHKANSPNFRCDEEATAGIAAHFGFSFELANILMNASLVNCAACIQYDADCTFDAIIHFALMCNEMFTTIACGRQSADQIDCAQLNHTLHVSMLIWMSAISFKRAANKFWSNSLPIIMSLIGRALQTLFI